MPVTLVRKDSYHDSVRLMRLTQSLKQQAGIEDAIVAMATPMNLELLARAGFAVDGAGPNDLVIAVRGAVAADDVERAVDALLTARAEGAAAGERRPASLGVALTEHPDTNLVLVSLPGEHAAREARRALASGRHVMLFSDNVALEDEVALKREGAAKGLLVMGPDCGTAILNGKPLAFANVVRRGPIGVVGASGTGLQEITSCIHRLGGGVSQAIGTGGRDLSEAVGGCMTLLGIRALAADPETDVIVVVSKPPAPAVAETVLEALRATPKPCVVQFVGAPPREPEKARNVFFADTLAGAAEQACRLAGLDVAVAPPVDAMVASGLAARLPDRPRLCGLFCGGTTGAEALVVLSRAGLAIRSNLHKKGELRTEGTERVDGHVLVDLGDDVFTQGRPHPMIEPVLRNERLLLELEDPSTALLLFDVVIGYGSHDDPAGLLVEGLAKARAKIGRELVAIASVTGTDDDPQDEDAQRRKLADAGVVVMPDNRRAAELVSAILARRRV